MIMVRSKKHSFNKVIFTIIIEWTNATGALIGEEESLSRRASIQVLDQQA